MNPPSVDLLAHDEWLRPMLRSLVAEDQVDDVLQDTWLIERLPIRVRAGEVSYVGS